MTILLYTTAACTLCERAVDVLSKTPELDNIQITEVDIIDNDQLFSEYGLRIPVLSVNGYELDWPFNSADIVQVLQTIAGHSQ